MPQCLTDDDGLEGREGVALDARGGGGGGGGGAGGAKRLGEGRSLNIEPAWGVKCFGIKVSQRRHP